MKIVVNNIDRLLRYELSKKCEIVGIGGNPKGAFIQWVSSFDDKLVELFNKQTTLISHCMNKGIPLIIFDKHQQMTEDEIAFLVKPGIFLWEPSLNDRMFFSYQPHWGKFPDDLKNMTWNFDEKREIDLCYIPPLKKLLPTFQKYYQPIAETGEYSVVYFGGGQNIQNKISGMGITSLSISHDDHSIKTTILLGTEREYRTGHLPPQLFDYLHQGIVPMLPKEHKWFHSIFDGLVVNNNFDVEYILKMYDTIGFGLICGVYEGLAEYLPESNVVNVSKRIISFFE